MTTVSIKNYSVSVTYDYGDREDNLKDNSDFYREDTLSVQVDVINIQC